MAQRLCLHPLGGFKDHRMLLVSMTLVEIGPNNFSLVKISNMLSSVYKGSQALLPFHDTCCHLGYSGIQTLRKKERKYVGKRLAGAVYLGGKYDNCGGHCLRLLAGQEIGQSS